jgi:hypothetical protein
VREESVWALVETALWFPRSGGRCFSVHGCGSVHAAVELREVMRDLHHLTDTTQQSPATTVERPSLPRVAPVPDQPAILDGQVGVFRQLQMQTDLRADQMEK